jgi:predicted NUDIX family NTP pyrophosphohydrolase
MAANKLSAGILLYRIWGDGDCAGAREPEVWLGHMGGPFWSAKDKRGWTIPKGEYERGDDELTAALREFEEEIGSPPPATLYADLGVFTIASGKRITVFCAEHDFHTDQVVSNTFELEWPKGSGRVRSFPEIDEARWFTLSEARGGILAGQLPILDALEARLGR